MRSLILINDGKDSMLQSALKITWSLFMEFIKIQASRMAWTSTFRALREGKVESCARRIDPLRFLMTKEAEAYPFTKEQSEFTLYQYFGGFFLSSY